MTSLHRPFVSQWMILAANLHSREFVRFKRNLPTQQSWLRCNKHPGTVLLSTGEKTSSCANTTSQDKQSPAGYHLDGSLECNTNIVYVAASYCMCTQTFFRPFMHAFITKAPFKTCQNSRQTYEVESWPRLSTSLPIHSQERELSRAHETFSYTVKPRLFCPN